MAAAELSIVGLLKKLSLYIINPLVSVLFVLALLIFFWGIFQFIQSETADTKRKEGQQKIMWSLVGMLIMFSAYGIIRVLLSTFGLEPSGYPFN